MTITDPATVRYLRELAEAKTGNRFQAMERFARLKLIPIIHKESADVLLYFIRTEAPRRILELGTAMGYSAIVMASEDPGITLDTIERDEDMVSLARSNIAAFHLEERIRLYEGDIDDVLPDLTGPYDLAFIDAAKSHYRYYLEESVRRLSPGGMIICDNVLVRGLIAHEGVMRKHSTIIQQMRSFLEEISLDPRFHAMVLPVGDGLLVLKSRQQEKE